MARYMVLVLDAAEVTRGARPIDRHTDEDALAAAQELLEPTRAAEVWQSNRLVGRVYGKQHLGPRL